jgi:hypothetical protein
VPGEQTDGKFSCLIHHHHRRVRILAPEIRRNASDDDARGHDADQILATLKSLLKNRRQVVEAINPRIIPGLTPGQPAAGPGQAPTESAGQGRALVGEGQDPNFAFHKIPDYSKTPR